MKQFKSVLAMLLALVMVISCVGTAFAAKNPAVDATKKTPISELTGKNEQNAKSLKGFKSPEFISQNTYRYADDETVRAIVVLEGAPETDVATRGSKKAVEQRAKLESEHAAVRKAMRGIDYEIAYEYTALLNGFSCDVAYGDLDAIASIDGVKAVYIANHYDAPVLEKPETELPEMQYAGLPAFTGNTAMNASGYTGKGMVIAVLDTGTRVTHEAFADTSLVEETLTKDDLGLAVADGVYVSEKIPFAYDYAEKDNDVTDYNGHGTHVAGIATGYLPTEDDGVAFSGAAPAAQLLAMKIFYDKEPGTSSDIYFFALEDAYRLGADVINMSIGSQNGFTYDKELETEVFGDIYRRLENAGIVICVAAGNEYSMAEFATFGYIGADYADYGTVASPSTYNGAISVAAMENYAYPAYVIELPGEVVATYVDSSEDGLWLKNFAGKTLDYVVIPNVGAPEDYEGIDVKGKIALVTRGSISFEEKVNYAAEAGAIGCIICDNVDGMPISMQISKFAIPAVSVLRVVGEYMKTAETKQISVPEGSIDVENPEAGDMCEFSNWGVDPMLEIKPNITSVGGHVWSSVNTGDGDYDVYSGTSMASPNAAGTYANLLQFLKEQGITDKRERAELATQLLESSATEIGGITEDNEFWWHSVRRQGAGIANAKDAMDAYLTSAYVSNPMQELGDDPEKTGVYEMSLEVVNASDAEVELSPFSIVMVDALAKEDDIVYNTLYTSAFDSYGIQPGASFTYTVDGEDVSYGFTVPAGGKVTVDVTVTLDDSVKEYLELFENGTYVEGYVSFQNYANATSAKATFLGFYGDWTKGPVLETQDFRDLLELDYLVGTEIADAEGNTYAELGYSPLMFMDFYTMPNMGYTFDTMSEEATYYLGGNCFDYAPYYDAHLSFATPQTDGDYYWADSFVLQPYQLRNARNLIMTVSDAETGEIYFVDNTEYLPKAVFDEEEEAWQSYGIFMWEGTNAYGEYVPSGTVAHVQFDAVLPYGEDPSGVYDGAVQENVWSFDVTVDYSAPVIENVIFDAETQTLTVTASDEQYLQAIYLTDINYSKILDAVAFSSDEAGESFTASFDVSGLIEEDFDEIIVTAMDYATNAKTAATYLFETDKDATVTLVTPMGATEYAVKTGETFVFPNCEEEYEGYQFLLWTRTNEETISDEDIWGIDGMFFEDDEIVVKGDETFYALYAVGEEVQLEKTNYYATQEKDYSGDWAIVGLDYADGNFDVSHPYAIGKDCEKVDVAALDDAEIGDWYVEFYTNAEGFRFTFENVGGKNYTIKNVATGKYLALADGELTMADEVSETAMWRVSANTQSSLGSLVYNVAEPDMILVYDDEKCEFAVYDNSEPYVSFIGINIYPKDIFVLWLYQCADSEFEAEYYTTTLEHTHTVVVDEAVTATCTETGLTEGSHCSVCGEVLSEQEIVPALGHDMVIDVAVAPTCTESGLGTGCHCSRCDEATLEQIVLAPLGHTVVIDPAVAATLTSTGLTEGSHCSVCGKVLKAQEIVPMLKDTACYYKDFSDCNDTWYHEAVDFTVSRELMSGIGDGKFDPNGTMTRAMMVTVLYRMAGSPAVSGPSSFTDVPEGQWYSDAIAWAQDNGIVLGVLADKFDPNGYVTREQIATILWRYENQPKAKADLSSFKDVASISEYAIEAMTWAVSEGIFQGDAGNLKPTANATRAEFACIIMRYLGGSYACEAIQ